MSDPRDQSFSTCRRRPSRLGPPAGGVVRGSEWPPRAPLLGRCHVDRSRRRPRGRRRRPRRRPRAGDVGSRSRSHRHARPWAWRRPRRCRPTSALGRGGPPSRGASVPRPGRCDRSQGLATALTVVLWGAAGIGGARRDRVREPRVGGQRHDRRRHVLRSRRPGATRRRRRHLRRHRRGAARLVSRSRSSRSSSSGCGASPRTRRSSGAPSPRFGAGWTHRRLVHPARQLRDPGARDAGPVARVGSRSPAASRLWRSRPGSGARRMVVGAVRSRRSLRFGSAGRRRRHQRRAISAACEPQDLVAAFAMAATVAAAILLILVIRRLTRRQQALLGATAAGLIARAPPRRSVTRDYRRAVALADTTDVDLRPSGSCGLALVPAAFVVAWMPVDVVPPCPLRTLTGIPCPLCGSTRGVVAAVHGHLGHAARAEPGIPARARARGDCARVDSGVAGRAGADPGVDASSRCSPSCGSYQLFKYATGRPL